MLTDKSNLGVDMLISRFASPPATTQLQHPHTLPADLRARTDEFLSNPRVYPFPALSRSFEGEPDEVNFDRVWELASNPVHWGDDSYHKIVDVENAGAPGSREGAWFTMTHSGFPLMPTVLGKQPFVGVIAETGVKGDPGARVGTVSLVELNTSGKSSFRAIPEHIQTLTVTERAPGQVDVKIGVRTAPSNSPEWLRKNVLIPWGRWHIQTDEADKLRTFEQRVFPDRSVPANPVQSGSWIGAAVGATAGIAACSGLSTTALALGTLASAAGGAGLGYYVASKQFVQAGQVEWPARPAQ